MKKKSKFDATPSRAARELAKSILQAVRSGKNCFCEGYEQSKVHADDCLVMEYELACEELQVLSDNHNLPPLVMTLEEYKNDSHTAFETMKSGRSIDITDENGKVKMHMSGNVDFMEFSLMNDDY